MLIAPESGVVPTDVVVGVAATAMQITAPAVEFFPTSQSTQALAPVVSIMSSNTYTFILYIIQSDE